MKAQRITEELIGKRYEGTIDGVAVKGEITTIEYSRFGGESFIHVQFDQPTKFWEADGDEFELDPMQTGGHYHKYKGASVAESELDFSAIR